MVADQPIIAASIGLAVGALLAASIPTTETENSLMGEASDAIKQQASTVFDEQVDKVSRAAGAVAEEMMSEAQSQGLTPETAASGVSTMADKLGAVADKTTQSIKREASKLKP